MLNRLPGAGRASALALPLFAFFNASAARAQLAPPVEKPVIGARMPALSPDGKTLAFVWRGDIWVSPASGGRAYQVTDNVESDAYPVFSPDGKWIAFSSTRTGNWDIFVVPATGGNARQMTFSSGAEIVSDWSPDGKTLLFTGQRDVPNSSVFALDVASLRFTKLTEDYKALANPSYSPDGAHLAFQRSGFPWTRPRYNGSGASQLWTLDLAKGKRDGIVDDGKQHLWPHYLPDGKSIACVTVGDVTPNSRLVDKPLPPLVDSAARTPNVWVYPTDGGKPRQITKMVGGGVRCPAVARKTGDMVFEWEDGLYRLAPGVSAPVKLALLCGADDKQNGTARQVFTNSDVTEAEISPDGKTFAFVLKSDIWTIPVEKGKGRNETDANRLTDYAGFDHDFVWTKDNKTVYFVSDRNGNDRLFALDTTTKAVRPVWTGTTDASSPQISPDGTQVGFWVEGSVDATRDDGGFYVALVAGGGAPRRILAVPGYSQGEFSWSPDGKWLAFTRRGQESGGYNIWITPADGTGKPVNVTRLNSRHRMPRWSPDGKYLFFQSNRDDDGLYVLPLKPEDARLDEMEIKYEKPKDPVTVAVDFEDTAPRIRKLAAPSPDADLTIGSDGQIFFVSGGDVYVCDYDGKNARKLTTTGGVSSLRVSPDAKTLYFSRGGGLWTLKMVPGNPQTPVAFTAGWERDLALERHTAFNQLWRTYNARYYDGDFHGRDWTAIKARYEPLLAGVATREEFATLLNMMIGEIESSHAEVGAAPGGVTGPSTRQLGVYFDYAYTGPGIRVKEVPKRAPGVYAKTRIKPGEYIVAVDGKDVTLDENLYKALNDKGDRDWVLLVNDKPTRAGARTVTYHALTGAEWADIHYRNRIERERKMVDTLSNGTLGYVHIAGMGGPNQITFDRELYEYAEGKKGIIIDVRFNGGGNIADQLINWLAMKPYGTWLPRNGFALPAPGGFARDGGARSWNKPIVVLMNENSFSNAEMFPDGMRTLGLAKLVGMPTPGYVIWTGGFTLVDGTSARMPGTGVYRKDGTSMENKGEQPDVRVDLTTEDWLANRDPQLARAVELLGK